MLFSEQSNVKRNYSLVSNRGESSDGNATAKWRQKLHLTKMFLPCRVRSAKFGLMLTSVFEYDWFMAQAPGIDLCIQSNLQYDKRPGLFSYPL